MTAEFCSCDNTSGLIPQAPSASFCRSEETRSSKSINGIDFVEICYPNTIIVTMLNTQHIEELKDQFLLKAVRKSEQVLLSQGFVCDRTITFRNCPITFVEGREYLIRIINDDRTDPRLSHALLVYNQDVNTEKDVLRPHDPARSAFSPPTINYLAKDYTSFRQVVLDRLALTLPNWQDTHAADIGMTLVELLAFAADRISYEQDAVATESYLSTSRLRTSVRRHARLVNYRLHEGCNARTFLQLSVEKSVAANTSDLMFSTEFPRRLQISDGILSETDISEKSWETVQVFQAVNFPPADWKLTPQQIKSERRSLDAVDKLIEILSPAGLPFISNDGPPTPPPADTDLEILTRKINYLLETFDLTKRLTDKVLQQEVGFAEFLQSCGASRLDFIKPEETEWNLPLAARNRLLLDRFLSKDHAGGVHSLVISKSKVLPRLEMAPCLNDISFYTWGEKECWLPAGATKATVCEMVPAPKQRQCARSSEASPLRENLHVGDWLLFEEVKGPKTNNRADADPTRRHIVRLTSVKFNVDPIHDRPLIEIEWSRENSLPFPMCLSSVLPAPHCQLITNVSVARGNLILVDHGRSLEMIPLGKVTGRTLQTDCGSHWEHPRLEVVRVPYQPEIEVPMLTYAESFKHNHEVSKMLLQSTTSAEPVVMLLGIPSADGNSPVSLPAAVLMDGDGARFEQVWRQLRDSEKFVLEDLLPPHVAYELQQIDQGQATVNSVPRPERMRQILHLLKHELTWAPRFDLFSSSSEDRHFVIEKNREGNPTLRFGDNIHGRMPEVGMEFFAFVRTGMGTDGNVGAETIKRLILKRGFFGSSATVRNPIPAQGGTNPESIESAKILAPHAYRNKQPRALRAQDYRQLVLSQFQDQVQSVNVAIHPSAAYSLVEVSIDPFSSVLNKEKLRARIFDFLNERRRINHLVSVSVQQPVPIDIHLTVTLSRSADRQTARLAVLAQLSDEILADGSLGFFHVDRVKDGGVIHSNQLVQMILQIPSVIDVKISRLSRYGDFNFSQAESEGWPEHRVVLSPGEFPQLDRRGSGKESGQVCLTLEGGR